MSCLGLATQDPFSHKPQGWTPNKHMGFFCVRVFRGFFHAFWSYMLITTVAAWVLYTNLIDEELNVQRDSVTFHTDTCLPCFALAAVTSGSTSRLTFL